MTRAGGTREAIRRILTWAVPIGLTASLVGFAACDTEGEFESVPEEDIGIPCLVHANCQYGCLAGVQGMQPYCTRSCVEEPCPAGYRCVSRAQLGLVCAMTWCGSDADCPENYRCYVDENVCQHGDIPCTVDDECPAATACNQGVCQTLCSSNDDCKQGYLCHWQTGCVQCIHNGDCSNGFACVGGGCNQACVAETDCREGYECLAGGACQLIVGGGPGVVGTPCSDDSECIGFCQHNTRCSHVCEGPGDPVCPDGYRCDEHHLTCQPTG